MVTASMNSKSVDFDPFETDKEIEKIVVINESQREIWLSCAIGGEPASLAYNESISVKLTGEFSFSCLKNAFDTTVQRHEALRSTLSANGEYFIVYKSLNYEVELIDLAGLSEKEKKSTFDGFLKNEMSTPIHLQAGPLFRVFVHRFTATEHYFTLVIHHIICDGWSMGIILENLSKAHNASKNGLSPNLPPVVQISGYAAQQHLFLQSDAFKETERFWLDLYKGDVPIIDLPTDYERGKIRTYKAARKDHKLTASLVNKLKETGSKAGCSLVNTMLSLFEIFLSQQTKQNDIVVGLPAAGQLATENHELVGHCVNILPIRSQIDPSQSFLTYLKQSRSVFLDAYENQLFSFGQLLKKLNFKRDSSRIPLVPIVFNIDMGMANAVAFDGLSYELISNPRSYETFEIFLNATGTQDDLVLEWTYNTQLFKETTIERMIAEFEALLLVFVVNPEDTIGQSSPVVSPSLEIASSIGPIADSHQTLLDLFQQSSSKYAKKTALRFNDEAFLYEEVEDQSNSLAAILVKEGVRKGDIVAIATERSPQMLVSLLAILKAGAAYLPLDPQYPKDRIEFMLEDANAKTIIISKKYHQAFQTVAKKLVIEELWPRLQKTDHTIVEVTGNDLAYVLYTSGSTGRPKGVQISHQNLANFLTSMSLEPGMTEKDRLLAITTISFDIAGLELFLPLITGAELVLATTEATKDGRLLLSMLKEQEITIMQATPSTWQMIIDSGWDILLPVKILSGGEALSKELAEKLLKLSKELWNMYGPTETTIWSTLKQILPDQENVTIGKAIQNTQVYVLNEQNMPLSFNEVGEICIGGEGVAAGYLNRAELTREKFINHFIAAKATEHIYKTGDLGKILPNGEILCLGRIDQQVKIRGHRIELSEIETVIAQQSGIKQAIVKAQEITSGDKRLVAYVIVDESIMLFDDDNNLASNAKLRTVAKNIVADWKEKLREYLPAYMVPDYYVALESFPLTPNAKIDRKALPTLNFSNVTNQNPVDLSTNERMVAEIWSSVLGIMDLKAKDDFFELGGHSLLAVKVMAEIEKKTGLRLPLSVLFENSTIGGLAAYLSKNHQTNVWKSLIPIKTSGTKPPIYFIHGAGLNVLLLKSITKYIDEDQPIYGIQAHGLNGETEIPSTLEEIVEKHIIEILESDPVGPYAIAGYSLGGYIAFEMAKQLQELGKEISFLGIIDTYAYNRHRFENESFKLLKKIRRQFYKLPYFTKSFLDNPKEAFNYQSYILKNKIVKVLSSDKALKQEFATEQDSEIYKIYDNACDNYPLKKLDIKINLFRVEKRLYYLDDSKYLGWNDLTTQKLDVHIVPGDHRTFLHAPYDKLFAGILQSSLNNVSK